MNKIVENQIADYVLNKKIKTRTILSNSFNMICEKIFLENSEAFVAKYYQNKEKGFNWRIKGKDRDEVTIKLYKNKPDYKEFTKQMKRVAGHEFGG